MSRNTKILIMALVVLSLSFIIGLLPIHGEGEVYDSVVRLHVIANSDSEEDQTLKLALRDEIIDMVTCAVRDCKTRAEAEEKIQAIMPEIQSRSLEFISESGYDYPVNVTLCQEEYPTKNYEACAFPAGKYSSLRVTIGEGKGQNWWCCLFPPLCMSASSKEESEEAFISVGFTPDQYKVITQTDKPKYRVRFKILELFEGIF